MLVVSVTVHDVGVTISQPYHVVGPGVLSVTCVPRSKRAAHGGNDVGVKLQLRPVGVLVTTNGADTELAGLTESCGGSEVNVAVAVPGAFAVHRHGELASGGHAPPHAVSTESTVPTADNCTCVPDTKSSVHVVVQLMPAGTLLTLPVPLTWTVSGTPGTKLTVSAVVPMPDETPQPVMGTCGPQLGAPPPPPEAVIPENTQPGAAVMRNETAVWTGTSDEHVPGQLIPDTGGWPTTVPLPITVTVKRAVGTHSNLATGLEAPGVPVNHLS